LHCAARSGNRQGAMRPPASGGSPAGQRGLGRVHVRVDHCRQPDARSDRRRLRRCLPFLLLAAVLSNWRGPAPAEIRGPRGAALVPPPAANPMARSCCAAGRDAAPAAAALRRGTR
jgi:hypothetical protein